jgi:hypothetical protein
MTFWQGGQNVVEKNRTKGANPTAVFRSPGRLQVAKRRETRLADLRVQSRYAKFGRIANEIMLSLIVFFFAFYLFSNKQVTVWPCD